MLPQRTLELFPQLAAESGPSLTDELTCGGNDIKHLSPREGAKTMSL